MTALAKQFRKKEDTLEKTKALDETSKAREQSLTALAKQFRTNIALRGTD